MEPPCAALIPPPAPSRPAHPSRSLQHHCRLCRPSLHAVSVGDGIDGRVGQRCPACIGKGPAPPRPAGTLDRGLPSRPPWLHVSWQDHGAVHASGAKRENTAAASVFHHELVSCAWPWARLTARAVEPLATAGASVSPSIAITSDIIAVIIVPLSCLGRKVSLVSSFRFG